ncbi:MAG: hypothetical protein ACXADW_23760 [Candidatus Hodarchaeales archaeon]|jgi:hypothetical protein
MLKISELKHGQVCFSKFNPGAGMWVVTSIDLKDKSVEFARFELGPNDARPKTYDSGSICRLMASDVSNLTTNFFESRYYQEL